MRADLHRLVDAVSRRTMRIEIDTALEQSARAVLYTDRVGDQAAVFTRYAASPADALQAVCLDGALWANAQPRAVRIETAWALPQLELASALAACVEWLTQGIEPNDGGDELAAVLANAHEALRRWGEP